MTKAVWTGAVTAAAVLFLSSPVFAANTDTATVQVNVTVNARAKLTLGGTGIINFADADPDLQTSLSAAAFSVNVKARTTAAGTVNLDVSAPDFVSGSNTIPIGKLSYAATGTGFSSAAFSNAVTSAGSWVGSGNQAGTHTYTLQNSWAYNTGSYTTTVTYTLTAP